MLSRTPSAGGETRAQERDDGEGGSRRWLEAGLYLKRECAPADSPFEVKWSVNGR